MGSPTLAAPQQAAPLTHPIEYLHPTRLIGSAGGVRSEPVGRAEQPAGGAPLELPPELFEQLSDEVVDQLLAGARSEEEIVGPGGVLAQLTKRLADERASGSVFVCYLA